MAPPTNPLLFAHSLLLLLLLLFLFISVSLQLSSATNSIFPNHSLSGNQTITSKGGKFVLGFFQTGKNISSHNFYIGIWYKNVSQLTYVWVANRETPVTDPTTSELKISDDGNLVLIDQSQTQIWSANSTFIASNLTVAVILDSGNLVLRDGSDRNKVFWQSCDQPTDTWIPGCYLGLNKVTGENRRLTSWKHSYDPAPGIFSLEIESSQLVLLWNNSMQYWSSGNWVNQTFSSWYWGWDCQFQYISNATVNYFTYFVEDDAMFGYTMDHSGKVQMLDWNGDGGWVEPGDLCSVYAPCGPFGSCFEGDSPFCNCPKGFSVASSWDWDAGDRSSGCVRDTPLQCGTKDSFFVLSNVIIQDNPHYLLVASAIDCELACLNNCSCTAYFYGSLCSVWYGNLLNLRQISEYGSNGETIYIRVGVSKLENSINKNGKVIWDVLGAIVGFMACLVVILLLFWRCQRRDMIGKIKMMEGTLVPFRYGELQRMTNNFSERLGGGGFGSVFKGMLPDSTAVAVKKLEGILQGEKQFRSEVSTIGAIQHVNLVRLRGFCSEGTKKLLVYEYMPKGSLDTKLFRSNCPVLDWKTRFQIALGTARGLSYLHEKCRDCIIHCDIKPENILLDDSFVPKVADFGLAKHVGRDFSCVLTTMRGTIGYLAPEWISGAAISAKADVYSFGMMLLEIISGRRNTEQLEEERTFYFPLLAANKVVERDAFSLLDPRLEGNANLEELDRACKVACWCIQDNEVCRPSMGQVVQILEGLVEVDTPPIPRLLQVLAENLSSILYFSDVIEAKLADEKDHLDSVSMTSKV